MSNVICDESGKFSCLRRRVENNSERTKPNAGISACYGARETRLNFKYGPLKEEKSGWENHNRRNRDSLECCESDN